MFNTIFFMISLLLSFCISHDTLYSQTRNLSTDQVVEDNVKSLLRYRLFQIREAALKLENESVLIEAVKASRKLSDNWDAISDSQKNVFFAKLENELGLSVVESLPNGLCTNNIPIAIPQKRITNLPYTTIEDVDPNLLSLDIYTPKDGQNYPVIVWLHGGAMKGGDKSHPGIVAIKPDYFNSIGYIFVSVNYRLAPTYKFPAQAYDVAAALSYLHDNIGNYGGNPDHLFIIGNSAGGHLAAIVSTDERYLQKYDKSPAIICGAVILDIGSFDIPSIFDQLGDKTPEMYQYTFGNDRQNWIDGSPMYHIQKGKSIPPFLLFYIDGREHHAQENNRFARLLRQHSYQATVQPVKNKTHITLAKDIGMSDDATTEKIEKFFIWAMKKSKI